MGGRAGTGELLVHFTFLSSHHSCSFFGGQGKFLVQLSFHRMCRACRQHTLVVSVSQQKKAVGQQLQNTYIQQGVQGAVLDKVAMVMLSAAEAGKKPQSVRTHIQAMSIFT